MTEQLRHGPTRGAVPPKLPNPATPKPGTVPAVATCAQHGWTRGDVLVSARWKVRKRIMQITPLLGMVSVADDARPNLGRSEIERFPDDVRRA